MQNLIFIYKQKIAGIVKFTQNIKANIYSKSKNSKYF